MESKVLFEHNISLWGSAIALFFGILPISGLASLFIATSQGLVVALTVAFISTIILVYFFLKKDKSSFRIYPDRISFFNPLWPEKEMNVWMKDVFQARYEDRDRGYDFVGANRILLYLKDGHTADHRLKTKKNRIILSVVHYRGDQDVISILKIFQAQGKQIYILTRSKKIKEALGLKNWDLSK